jgi:hypothetical protein
VWNRFRAAADKFFERYHNRHQIALSGKLAEREAMVVELETLTAEGATLPDNAAAHVQQLRTTWNRAVPIPAAEAKALADRWQVALSALVQRHRDLFKGTDLDPEAARARLEKLVAKIESFLADVPEAKAGLSATEALAARLRTALASNAMGGRASEDAKWRAAADAVKEAQAAWDRLSPVAGAEARDLESRFRDACRRVNEQARRHPGGHRPAPPARRPHPPRPTAAATA